MTRAAQPLMALSDITMGSAVTVNSTTGVPRANFNSDGTITYTSNGIAGLYYPQGWYRNANFGREISGAGSGYEARLTPSSGAFGLELTGTWVSLSAGTSWNRSTAGNGSSVGLLEIRDASTQAVMGRATLTLNDN